MAPLLTEAPMYFRLTFKTVEGKTRTEWVRKLTPGAHYDLTLFPIDYEVVDKQGDPKGQFIRTGQRIPAKVQKTYEDGSKDVTHLVRAQDILKQVPAKMDKKYAELEVA